LDNGEKRHAPCYTNAGEHARGTGMGYNDSIQKLLPLFNFVKENGYLKAPGKLHLLDDTRESEAYKPTLARD
jgi:hypothetical protein